uniref:Uncharacterized protein n=1 Tax=Gouania willdenowi TaxID=441366 RepID=A0A8C5DF83_GOUWI
PRQTGHGRTEDLLFALAFVSSGPTDVCLEKQVERFEWQLRILKQVLSANGNPERAELLKEHADEEVCALVLSIFDKVKTETTADLNVLHEQKSKSVSEENEALLEELQTKHQQEKNQLTQTFVASENILKDKVRDLSSELQVYNNLKRRVTESNFNRDLQRNIQNKWRVVSVYFFSVEDVEKTNRCLIYTRLVCRKTLHLPPPLPHHHLELFF